MVFLSLLANPFVLLKRVKLTEDPVSVIARAVCADGDILSARRDVMNIVDDYGLIYYRALIARRPASGKELRCWKREVYSLVRFDHFAHKKTFPDGEARRAIVCQKDPTAIAVAAKTNSQKDIKLIDEKAIDLAILRWKMHWATVA